MTGLSHPDCFWSWDPGFLTPPLWAHRARLEGERSPHLESIRRAGRARAPGRGCGRGRGAGERCLPAPRRGLGVRRARRLPQLVFIPRSDLGLH